MAKSSSAMGHFWLSKFHSTSVISINFFSNVKFSFWWERNLSIFMKGSATGLLANLSRDTPDARGSKPSLRLHLRVSYEDGG